LSSLRTKGVIGDVAFNPIGGGETLQSGFEDLLFHINLTTLKNLASKRERSVVLIGGGSGKLAAIKVALAAGIFNRMVTDRATAKSLLPEVNAQDLSIGFSLPH